MSAPTETLVIHDPKVACVGDKDIPHPRVFLKVGKDGVVTCPYCGKIYVFQKPTRESARA